MTAITHLPAGVAGGHGRQATGPGHSAIRLAVLDSDTGFLQVLGKRCEAMGWPHRIRLARGRRGGRRISAAAR